MGFLRYRSTHSLCQKIKSHCVRRRTAHAQVARETVIVPKNRIVKETVSLPSFASPGLPQRSASDLSLREAPELLTKTVPPQKAVAAASL